MARKRRLSLISVYLLVETALVAAGAIPIGFAQPLLQNPGVNQPLPTGASQPGQPLAQFGQQPSTPTAANTPGPSVFIPPPPPSGFTIPCLPRVPTLEQPINQPLGPNNVTTSILHAPPVCENGISLPSPGQAGTVKSSGPQGSPSPPHP